MRPCRRERGVLRGQRAPQGARAAASHRRARAGRRLRPRGRRARRRARPALGPVRRPRLTTLDDVGCCSAARGGCAGRYRRTARFRCVIALVDPGGRASRPRRWPRASSSPPPRPSGFGYDPIFYYPPLGRTFAELSDGGQGAVSHRGRAVASVRRLLRECYLLVRGRLMIRGVAQPGSAPALGAGGRGFKSSHPDKPCRL